MRIIAGRFRGLRLETPAGDTTRPITDRVKESLFNILCHQSGTPGVLPEYAVLDLFAGTGGLGIEALSRGASTCLFVERERRALRTLRSNLERLRSPEAWRISTENAWAMRVPPAGGAGYDLVFVDPPYSDTQEPLRAFDLLQRLAPRLASAGIVVFRCAASVQLPDEAPLGLVRADVRTFGKMRVVFFRRAAAAPDAAADSA
ncbi:MAG: 16S rRNA (guanine(966)-N(2))-methyltransferase RsmD [Planctomycetes bacterium]|nr:16S rRNA (guanine(966)-N(2))-methyltransferase RsmD [Planctomycetota bacterium]